MVKMACFSWKPRRNSDTDQKLLQDAVPTHNGVPDLDQSGNEIPGGLAGIRQRMAAMGHTMNPHPVQELDVEQEDTGNNDHEVAPRRQRRAPAQGDENVNGNSDGGFTLSVDVITEDGNAVKDIRTQPEQQPTKRSVERNGANEQGSGPILLGSAGDSNDAPHSAKPIILGPPEDENVISLGPPPLSSPSEAIVLGPPSEQQTVPKASDERSLGPPPGQISGAPAQTAKKSTADSGQICDDNVPSQVRKLNLGGSKKKQENFLLELASLETAQQDNEAEAAQKRALGMSTSDLDAVEGFFPGRDEVQKHLQVLSPGYKVNITDAEGEFQDVSQDGEDADGQSMPRAAEAEAAERAGGSHPEEQEALGPRTPAKDALSTPQRQDPPEGREGGKGPLTFQGKLSRFQAQASAAAAPPPPAASSPARLDTTALSSHSIRSPPPPDSPPKAPPPSAPQSSAPAPPAQRPPPPPPSQPHPPAGFDDPDHLRVSPVPTPERRPPQPPAASPPKPPPAPPPHTQPNPQPRPPAPAPPPPPPAPPQPSAAAARPDAPPPPAQAPALPLPPPPAPAPLAAPRAGFASDPPRLATLLPALQAQAPATPQAQAGEGAVALALQESLSPRAGHSPAMGVDRGRDLILQNIIAFRCQHPGGAFHDWLVKLTPDQITEAIMRSSKGTGIWRELWDSVSLDLDTLQD